MGPTSPGSEIGSFCDSLHSVLLSSVVLGLCFLGLALHPGRRWTGKKALAGGGCLTTQATHVLDLMQWFMGGQCGTRDANSGGGGGGGRGPPGPRGRKSVIRIPTRFPLNLQGIWWQLPTFAPPG
jgi:hypothetical protein